MEPLKGQVGRNDVRSFLLELPTPQARGARVTSPGFFALKGPGGVVTSSPAKQGEQMQGEWTLSVRQPLPPWVQALLEFCRA